MRYEKGRKDQTRRRITDVAANRFRSDGIAASGLAGIMSEAGLTNGAFYPHFGSKGALVRESISAALEDQADQIEALLAAGGPSLAIDAYLSREHRDNPGVGCVSSALLPEIAREPAETREAYAERFLRLVRLVAAALPQGTRDPEATSIAVFGMLIGSLELARAVAGTGTSDRILECGATAAKALIAGAQSSRTRAARP